MHRPVRGGWPARIAAVVAAAMLALLLSAVPASAHNVLISSNPADGAVLDTAPETVSFRFDQPIQNFDPVLDVFGPNGNSFATAGPTIDGATISVPMAAGPAGEYRAAYRIVSADGHPVTGQITFTLTEAAAGAATGTPTTSANVPSAASPSEKGAPAADDAGAVSGGLGAWLWVGLVVVAILVIGAIVFALRKPGPPPTS